MIRTAISETEADGVPTMRPSPWQAAERRKCLMAFEALSACDRKCPQAALSFDDSRETSKPALRE
jgi:hypothetical protein